jgi:predicted nucleic acid-binding protein
LSGEPTGTSAWTIDASIALKWFLPDEADERAIGLLLAYRESRVQLSAPAFIRYELANGLTQAFRRGRIDEEAIENGMRLFLALGLQDDADSDNLIERAVAIAMLTGATPYDATYVAHAEAIGNKVLSSDKGMLSRSRGFPVQVVALKDIP